MITGINGFVGPHLARVLMRRGFTVYGLLRSAARPELCGIEGRLHLIRADLKDEVLVRHTLAEIQPTRVFHLAAATGPATLESMLETNVLCTAHLLAAAMQLAESGLSLKVVLVGSASEYGEVFAHELPVTEQQIPRPTSAYGISKLAQTGLLRCYRHPALKISIGRPFNVVGPGEPPKLVCSAIAQQIAAVEAGCAPPVIKIGNLLPERDFVDVRDVAEALWAIGERGRSGDAYNICTGGAVSIGHILESLVRQANAPIRADGDAVRLRRGDVARMVGDPQKINRELDWVATTPIEQSLGDLLRGWRLTYGVGDVSLPKVPVTVP